MRHARRLIAVIIGCAAWCIAVTTVAYARPDPGPVVIAPASTTAAATSTWEFVAMAALGALLALAVVGLIVSLRRSRASERSPESEKSRGLRA